MAQITSCAFDGLTANIAAAADSSAPHLWAARDGVLLTIACGATAEELLAVEDSLQVCPAAIADQRPPRRPPRRIRRRRAPPLASPNDGQ